MLQDDKAKSTKEEIFFRAFLTLFGFIFLFQCFVAQGTWLVLSCFMAVFLFAFGVVGNPQKVVDLSQHQEQ